MTEIYGTIEEIVPAMKEQGADFYIRYEEDIVTFYRNDGTFKKFVTNDDGNWCCVYWAGNPEWIDMPYGKTIAEAKRNTKCVWLKAEKNVASIKTNSNPFELIEL